MTGPAETTRRFTAADQQAFAALSGDWNPIHLDPVAARRTLAGGRVVHGVHAALWALEVLARQTPPANPPSTIRAQFHKFIPVDREVELRVSSDGLVVQIMASGLLSVTVTLTVGPLANASSPWDNLPLERPALAPRLLTISGLDGAEGRMVPPDDGPPPTELFPDLCDWIGPGRVEALAQASAVVGMACPGLHSIFSGFAVRLVEPGEALLGLGYRARVPDARYGRVTLALQGAGIEGEASAMLRPEPVAQPGMNMLSTLVDPGEFAGRRALIVGGSRGLGALTAKLLAAGGAEIALTYALGAAEAAEVAGDIRAARPEAKVEVSRCDVREGFETIVAQASGATHLYYFATPPITRQAAAVYSAAVLAEFLQVYVHRFAELCDLALAGRADTGLSVLYPSTVFIDDRPKGMTEYAMSKAAGEQLCKDLARANLALRITTPRLPRMLTDQTASPLPLRTDDAVSVLLPLLRAEETP